MSAQMANNKYENEWKQVAEMEEQQLPQSATKLVDDILQKAIKAQNNTQVIKALIYKNKYKKQIDRADNDALFSDLQNLIDNTKNIQEKALLHSMLAELYADYYLMNRWTINRRTNLSDIVPTDMKEWSRNVFTNKILENINLSVKEVVALKSHTTKEYDDIIILGNQSQRYYPTLYDFLSLRAIGIAKLMGNNGKFDTVSSGNNVEQLILPATEYVKLDINIGAGNQFAIFSYYHDYLKDLLNRNLLSTVVLLDLDRVEYISRNSYSFSGKKVLDAYISLYDVYQQNETSVEIIDKIVDSYNYDYRNQSDNNKSKYEWLQKGIQKYPNYYAIDILKNKLIDLEMPTFNIKGKDLHYSKTPVKFDILHKNIHTIADKPILKLYKVENDKYSIIKDYPITFVSNTTYNTDTLSLDLGILSFGKYCLSSLSKDQLEKKDDSSYDAYNNRFNFVVSDLISFTRNSAKDEYEIFVVDRISGKPIKDGVVKIYPNNKVEENGFKATINTSQLGLVTYKDNEPLKDNYRALTYTVEYANDKYLKSQNLYRQDYRWQTQNEDEEKRPQISIFTDRGIYRPGQTIYYKAIIINDASKPVSNKTYTVKLYDINNQLVTEKDVVTNEFGSVSGEFVLPQSGLQGQYRIEIDNDAAYFNVEEYKRPTFEITFDKVDKTYTFGEEVTLKGYAKNFSGISLQDAEVKFNITREQFSFWFWRSGNKSPFTDGVVKTNADGSFEIKFTPEAGDGNRLLLRSVSDRQIYTFDITATITDINGETQSNTYTLTVGNVSMVMNIDIPEQVEKNSDYTIKIGARNLQAQDIETSGSYIIYKLDDNDSIQNKITEGSFKTGEQTEIKNKLKQLSSGKYRLLVKALDSKRKEVEEKKDFILYSYSDKRPPIKTNEWLIHKNTEFGKNKVAEVIFGTTENDTYVLYQLSNNDKVFERRFIKLSNSNHLFKVNYKPEYGDGINMSLTSVKDGKIFNQNISLKKEEKVADVNLNLKFEVFRDKLRPGQAETWTVSIKDDQDKPVLAELLASMYDSSLDKLYPYMAWSFNRPYLNTDRILPLNYNFPWYNNDNMSWFDLNYEKKYNLMKPRTIDIINWFDYITSYRGNNNILNGCINSSELSYQMSGDEVMVIGYGSRKKVSFTGSISKVDMKSMAAPAAGGMIAGIAVENGSVGELALTAASDEAEFSAEWGQTGIIDKLSSKLNIPQIRQNFNETAFFYPQLHTNEKGEVQISFTVPESNTTWRFRALAHDKDARTGTLEKMVVTRKELMVTPNMPRFVRQGDKTSISTKISNLSENAISGDVRIEFFDPITEKALDLNITNQNQTFSIEKDASTSVSWTFDIPTDIELIGCRIVAQNATFSDGEQHVLAVLPNRMLVTESMPIDVTKSGKSTFTFDKLYNNKSNTLENYKLTLEYASNPAWYAVQALPTMSNPANENAVNWFAAYYVNTLGSSIVRQYPKVAAMIQAWQKQGGDKQTLVSNLQKNEELKAVLLEETPWVLEAKNESEQMQRLSLLFDLNNANQLTDAATRKLKELMNDDGGWAWYKGLYPSRAISQYILYGYAKLQLVGQVQYSQEIKEMQMKALRYIDSKILEDYNNLKKNNKNWKEATRISTNQLEFAYVRSFYRDIPINQETREAERFYTNVVAKNWTKLNLYEMSILSVLLQKNGDKELAAKIVKSIREHAVKDKSLGMYWPNNRMNVFMSMSAISVHTFLMDALQENGATDEEMDMMKRWLLKQKQTQVWESTHASIDAISALLSTGNDWFSGEISSTKVQVGDKVIQPDNKDIGTGYFKTTWYKTEINNAMAKVEIDQSGTQPAYGAIYWQYYENLDKISIQKGQLNVDKQLFKEVENSSGKTLVPITENNPLTVGDKVIMRLVVRVDRDMEFVQLKDMRAPCFEPQQTLSGVKWADNLIYYQTTKDASTNFYFDRLPKGTYVLEYPVYVNRSGDYSNGITTIQCLYAPEFVSHTQGIKVTVKNKE